MPTPYHTSLPFSCHTTIYHSHALVRRLIPCINLSLEPVIQDLREKSVEDAGDRKTDTSASDIDREKPVEVFQCVYVDYCGSLGTSEHSTGLYNMNNVVLHYQLMG